MYIRVGPSVQGMLVSLPLILILLDYWPLERFQFHQVFASSQPKTIQKKKKKHRNRNDESRAPKMQEDFHISNVIRPIIVENIPFFILALISSVIAIIAAKTGGAVSSLDIIPFSYRIGNALIAYVKYMIQMFYPIGLAVFYPLQTNLNLGTVAAAFILLVMVTIFITVFAKRSPYLAVGWFWYIITLAPVIGIFQVGTQAMADRYAYIPLIGLFFAITWGVVDIFKNMKHKIFILSSAALVIIGLIMTGTWSQLKYWRNSTTLFQHTVSFTKNNDVAHNNLGAALKGDGRIEEAVSHFRRIHSHQS